MRTDPREWTVRQSAGLAIALGILGTGLGGHTGNLLAVGMGGTAVTLGVLTLARNAQGATDAEVRRAVEDAEDGEDGETQDHNDTGRYPRP